MFVLVLLQCLMNKIEYFECAINQNYNTRNALVGKRSECWLIYQIIKVVRPFAIV